MTTQNLDDERLNMLAAAYLLAGSERSKIKQIDIAEILEIQPVAVSRLLNKARDEGLLRTAFNYELASDADIEKVEARIRKDKRIDKLKKMLLIEHEPYLKSVSVFYSGVADGDSVSFSNRLGRFSDHSARCVMPHLKNSKYVGLAWGRTISALVQSLKALHPTVKSKSAQISFVPLVGEPLGVVDMSRFSSTQLVRELDLLMNGSATNSLSLHGILALIPTDIPKKNIASIYSLLEHAESYRSIFGTPSTRTQKSAKASARSDLLVSKLDCIITSVSEDGAPWGMTENQNFVKTARLNKEKLSEESVGDIGGVLMPRLNTRSEYLEDLALRWTGIQHEHLLSCAENCANDKDRKISGVIVASIGERKKENIRRALEQNYINHLIIDHELAAGLADLYIKNRD